MSPPEIDGLEIHAWESDRNFKEMLRQSFRVPVDKTDDITVKIDNQRFVVVNISPSGIGILLEQVGTFVEGDTTLVVGGFLANRGYLDLAWVISLIALSTFILFFIFCRMPHFKKGPVIAKDKKYQ